MGDARGRKRRERRGRPLDEFPDDESGLDVVLSSGRLRAHRNRLEHACPVDEGACGAREVSTAAELEATFRSTGLDAIAVYRAAGRPKEDVFKELHMSYPIRELEDFKTRLGRFVDEELTIPTINVGTQGDGRPLTLGELVAYFNTPASKRDVLLNVTSFNLGLTGLDGLVMAPRVVRDLDLVSRVWPSQRIVRFFDDLVYNPFAFVEEGKIGKGATAYDVYSPPKTMAYLLLGPEGAYTDWHVDFAGSSVWYHVVKGTKIFMAAPDTPHNVREFLSWSSDDQAEFLGDRLEKCVRVKLTEGDTLFLPGGWFHAVSTPEDSVVVGGNFINPLRLKQLLTVREIERQLGISPQAEYPKFNMLMYYAAGDFIKRCQQSRAANSALPGSIVTPLEARGLESLAVYLESTVMVDACGR